MFKPGTHHYRLQKERQQQRLRQTEHERLVRLAQTGHSSQRAPLKQVAQWLVSAVNVFKHMGLLLLGLLAAIPSFIAAAAYLYRQIAGASR